MNFFMKETNQIWKTITFNMKMQQETLSEARV